VKCIVYKSWGLGYSRPPPMAGDDSLVTTTGGSARAIRHWLADETTRQLNMQGAYREHCTSVKRDVIENTTSPGWHKYCSGVL